MTGSNVPFAGPDRHPLSTLNLLSALKLQLGTGHVLLVSPGPARVGRSLLSSFVAGNGSPRAGRTVAKSDDVL